MYLGQGWVSSNEHPCTVVFVQCFWSDLRTSPAHAWLNQHRSGTWGCKKGTVDWDQILKKSDASESLFLSQNKKSDSHEKPKSEFPTLDQNSVKLIFLHKNTCEGQGPQGQSLFFSLADSNTGNNDMYIITTGQQLLTAITTVYCTSAPYFLQKKFLHYSIIYNI